MASDGTPAQAPRKVAVSFTGGKDSSLVVHLLREPAVAVNAPELDEQQRRDIADRVAPYEKDEVCLLVTFVPAGGQQSFKAHPLEVVQLQARALGLPHIVMEVSAPYLESYRDNIARLRTEYGITVLATGDILDVCSSFMPRAAEGTGVLLACPLWAIQRQLLLELVWAYQLQPLVTCVNVAKFLEPTPTPAPAAGGASAVAGGATGQGATDGQGAGNVEAAAPAAASCPAAAAGKIAAGVAGGQSVVSSGKAAGDGVGEVECGSSTGANGAQARAAGEEAEVAVKARGFPTVGEHGPEGLLGCVLDRSMMQQLLLPARELFGVDECGEMGEFHTMCMSGLLMRAGGGEVGEGSGQQLAGAAGRRGHLRLRTEAKREGDYAYLALQEVELVEA